MTKRSQIYTIAMLIALVLNIFRAQAQSPVTSTKKEVKNQASKIIPDATGFPTITGNGNVGQIPYFTAGTIIRNSIITQSKSNNIGIDTDTPTSKLTVAGMIETTLGGLKFPDSTVQTTAGLSSVIHDATLTGNGTSASPLAIANGGVGTVQLANNAVTSTKIAPGAVMTAQLADNSVIAAKIASGQIVKSINGLTDNLTLAAGSNITITPVGNMLTIAASGGAESTGASAFQGRIQGGWGDGDGIAHGTLIIPAGKRLVVEFISVTVSLILGQSVVDTFLESTLDGNEVPYRIAVNSNPSFPVSPFTHVVDKPVRIYADSLSVSMARSPASGGAFFEIIVSGHLVDLP